jgi:protein-S-isoprenylcysteine O-methyltransferase Ste14
VHPVTLVLEIVTLLWVASEVALAFFARGRGRLVRRRDAGSLAVLWSAVALGILAATLLVRVRAAAIPFPVPWLHAISLLILVTGLAIRATAILTLGRFFTTSVTVLDQHRLVHSGLYRRVRHPAYTGLLIAFFGLGVSFANWLSLPAVVVPIFAALLYRIRVEESALIAALGEDYRRYRKETKSLIPGLC